VIASTRCAVVGTSNGNDWWDSTNDNAWYGSYASTSGNIDDFALLRLWEREEQLALSRAWEDAPVCIQVSRPFVCTAGFARRIAPKSYTGRNYRKVR